MKNQISDFYFLSYDRFCSQFSNVFTLITIQFIKKLLFKSGQIYMTNELKRMKDKFSDIYFLSYDRFYT